MLNVLISWELGFEASIIFGAAAEGGATVGGGVVIHGVIVHGEAVVMEILSILVTSEASVPHSLEIFTDVR